MPPFIFNEKVTVKRRLSLAAAPRDVLNNPTFGAPTATWTTVNSALPCRLAFSSKELIFAATGERVTPSGVMYTGATADVKHEDRIITASGVEYVVVSVVQGLLGPTTVSHLEITLALP